MKNYCILITNDDGLEVDGIAAAIQAVKGVAPVLVAVPRCNQSGLSHRITMKKNIRVRKLNNRWPWTDGVYVVDGTPADCVRLGIFSLSRRPIGLVIAGINHGANMGEDVVYSGTVAAAREGAMRGIKSMAVSVSVPRGRFPGNISQVIRSCAVWILKHTFPQGTFFNINIPAQVDLHRTKAVFTRLGKRVYGTQYQLIRKTRTYRSFMLKEHVSGLLIKGTDICAVARGKISITPLTLTFTDTNLLKQLKKSKSFNAKCTISN